jgi:hypothetical protein
MNSAEIETTCGHYFCKKCYKTKNLCIICNKKIETKMIYNLNNTTTNLTTYIYLDPNERTLFPSLNYMFYNLNNFNRYSS